MVVVTYVEATGGSLCVGIVFLLEVGREAVGSLVHDTLIRHGPPPAFGLPT